MKTILPLLFGACLTLTFTARGDVLFFEDFAADLSGGDQPISVVGWNNAIDNFDTRIYGEGAVDSGSAVWSWVGGGAGAFMEVFYTTSDTPDSGFEDIDLAQYFDLVFSVDNHSQNTGTDNTFGHFAVKIEDQWYATAEAVAGPTGTWTNRTMGVGLSASEWRLLTIPSEGETSTGESGTFGDAPDNDLSGTIVGVGFVVDRTAGNGTQNWSNFMIEGTLFPEDDGWMVAYEDFTAPFSLTFGTGQDTQDDLLRAWSEDFTLQGDSLRFEPARDGFSSSTALASVENYQTRQDFSLEAEMTLTELTGWAENRVGFSVLGGPHNPPDEPFFSGFDSGFYGLVWIPADENGESVLQIREGFRGEVLQEAVWEGKAVFEDGVILSEDFEDVSAAESAWSWGGTPSDLWEIGVPSVGPDGAVSGANVAGTDLDGFYGTDLDEAWLRSPAIDLTGVPGATLSYQEFVDIDDELFEGEMTHFMTVSVLEAGTNALIDGGLLEQYNENTDWRLREFELPPAALDREIVIEFRLHSDGVINDDYAGWYIDDFEITGAALEPATFQLAAEGVFDPGGMLSLSFILTDEDEFSQSISTDIFEPFDGNLFGIGGRSRSAENAIFDFHGFSMEVGDEPSEFDPGVQPPFSFAFGSDEGRNDGESFIRNVPGDWMLVEDALQLSTSAGDAHNSVGTTRVIDFEPGENFLLESTMTVGSLDGSSDEHRAGLVLFGAEDAAVYDPDDDSTFHTFQWIPHSAGGGSIAVRQGFDGAIVAQTDFADLDNPPEVAAGTTYTFRFLGTYNGSGELEFFGVLSDGSGGVATISDTIANPPADSNRFGFGARHSGTGNPVWNFHTFAWSDSVPLPMPLDYSFGTAAGRDSDADFQKNDVAPDNWSLEPDTLRHTRTDLLGPAVAGSTASTGVLDYAPRQDFGARAVVTPGEATSSLEFQGGSHVLTEVTAADLGIDGNNPRTIEAWGYTRIFDNNATLWTMGAEENSQDFTLKVSSGEDNWVMNMFGADDLFFEIPDSADRWIHFAVVYDGATVFVYVDGELAAEASRALNTADTNPVRMGWWQRRGAAQGLDGSVRDVRVWNVARTQEEIQADLDRRLEGNESGLVAYWPMDEGDGETVNDLVAGNHGTLQAPEGDEENLPEWTVPRFGLTFIGESTDPNAAYSLQWEPINVPGGGVLRIVAPGGDSLGDVELSSLAEAPVFEAGSAYTLQIAGQFNAGGSLGLTGTLSDENGGEAELTTTVATPVLPAQVNRFGMTGRYPELDWHRYRMGTPEQLDIDPVDPEPGVTFAEWQTENFGDETDPAIIGPAAEPAGDGVANLVKYALGFPDAFLPVSGADLPQPEISDGMLQLTYLERGNAAEQGISYHPELSIELADDWSGESVTETGRVAEGAFFRVTIEAEVPGGATKGFVRVSVRQSQ